MTTRRSQPLVITQRQTCEGCSHLRPFRPMCMAETSPNFRMVRGSYQDRCQAYDVKGRNNQQTTGTRP
jgi:hypothetical protein